MADQPNDAGSNITDSLPRNLHDSLFKMIFGDPALAADELRAVLPEDVSARIDWATLAPAPTNLVDTVFQQRFGDLVFHARFVDQGEVLLWFLLEHQSTEDWWMTLRMVEAASMMWQSWRVLNKDTRHLPAIVPVVVYHGSQPWRAPTAMGELFVLPEPTRASLGEHLMSYRFVLDDLSAVEDEALRARRMNALAKLALFAMARGVAEDFLDRLQSKWAQELGIVLTVDRDERISSLMLYILYVNPRADVDALQRLVRSVPGASTTIEEVIMLGYEKIMQKGVEKGIEKGVEKGIEKGIAQEREERRGDLLRLLEKRFGPVPAPFTARVAAASGSELASWTMRVLDAERLEDVFAGS